MRQCKLCLLSERHPFGIHIDAEGLCSGCRAFSDKKQNLQHFNAIDYDKVLRKITADTGHEINRAIVPLQFDNETHFVIDSVLAMGIQPIVVYFNAQYHDQLTFNYLSNLQEIFDVDFIGLTLPKDILQKLVMENIISNGNPRKFEIIGQYAAALFVADALNIPNIVSGPLQSSEVVGNISWKYPSKLTFPEFADRIVVHSISAYESTVIQGVNSPFSTAFRPDTLMKMIDKINWRFLGDYIFWDSVQINDAYRDKYQFEPRHIPGYGSEYQAISSSLKLNEFELIRLMHGFEPRILSYLCRDIRSNVITRERAETILIEYCEKDWQIGHLSEFLEVPCTNIGDVFSLLMKKCGSKFSIRCSSNGDSVMSHGQMIK